MKGAAYILIVAAQLIPMVGCQNIPSATRTGDMKEIFVTENVSLAELSVAAGDEVRWTNRRRAPISIVFLEPVHSKISCRNNFSGFFTGGNETTLEPNESASLCFREQTYSSYIIRMNSAVPGEAVNVSGAIRVGGPLRQSSTQELPTDNNIQR
jgi:hypothetical protein